MLGGDTSEVVVLEKQAASCKRGRRLGCWRSVECVSRFAGRGIKDGKIGGQGMKGWAP